MKNKLYFLGSVSPYSTDKDNCPGYFAKINNTNILLDCGFGVCKKLKLPRDYKNLNIFISHFHKDHYSDIYAIGYASYVHNKLGILKDRIKLYIPKVSFEDQEYLDYLQLKNFKEHYFEIIEYNEFDKFKFDNIEISFMKNYHSINTYSTKIKYDDSVFIYASDLGYKTKAKLVEFSMNAKILLIESSFVKSDNKTNEFHLHSFEAANIAQEAKVKQLILTHFWPEHNKKMYLIEAKKIFSNVKLAKTNLTIKL